MWDAFGDCSAKCAQPIYEMLIASFHPVHATDSAGTVRAQSRDHERRARTQIGYLKVAGIQRGTATDPGGVKIARIVVRLVPVVSVRWHGRIH